MPSCGLKASWHVVSLSCTPNCLDQGKIARRSKTYPPTRPPTHIPRTARHGAAGTRLRLERQQSRAPSRPPATSPGGGAATEPDAQRRLVRTVYRGRHGRFWFPRPQVDADQPEQAAMSQVHDIWDRRTKSLLWCCALALLWEVRVEIGDVSTVRLTDWCTPKSRLLKPFSLRRAWTTSRAAPSSQRLFLAGGSPHRNSQPCSLPTAATSCLDRQTWSQPSIQMSSRVGIHQGRRCGVQVEEENCA